jgi:hypothetical protein
VPTLIDLPKVAQMLDAGWRVRLFKNRMGSYTARAKTRNADAWERARAGCHQQMLDAGWSAGEAVDINGADFDTPGEVETDDFTPEAALTRLAYKVHGQILVDQ